jgi:hypothetical protein
MPTIKHLGIFDADADGANATFNLANFAIGTDGVGLGIIAANETGPIPPLPVSQQRRTLVITIDNRDGTNDAYLARPEDIPAVGTETLPIGGLVIPQGTLVEYSGYAVSSWSYILRLLDGADVRGTVAHTGPGW